MKSFRKRTTVEGDGKEALMCQWKTLSLSLFLFSPTTHMFSKEILKKYDKGIRITVKQYSALPKAIPTYGVPQMCP